MATHPGMDELVDGAAVKGALDGDLSVRRKDEQSSGYLDDIEAIRGEVRRAAAEDRAPNLKPFTAVAIGAAGITTQNPEISDDEPVVVDFGDINRNTAPPAPSTLPAQKVKFEGLENVDLSVKGENDNARSSDDPLLHRDDDEETKKENERRLKKSRENQELAAKANEDKSPPTGASNEAPQVDPSERNKEDNKSSSSSSSSTAKKATAKK